MQKHNQCGILTDKKEYHNSKLVVKDDDNKQVNIHWGDNDIEKIRKEISQLQKNENDVNEQLKPYKSQMDQLEQTEKRNLDKVHQYNEIKDSAQAMIGKLAEYEGITIAQMNKKMGIDINDEKPKF